MSKHTYFFGQPIFSQLLSLIDRKKVSRMVARHNSDHYYKTLPTWKHLVSMLYCSFSGATALRELSTGLLACEQKLCHLGIDQAPRRSTLSDGNAKRSSRLFGDIYMHLVRQFQPGYSDSQIPHHVFKRLYLIDSTVFSLFKNILSVAGRPRNDGRSKGGIKAHTMVKASQMMPTLVRFSAASTHDQVFLNELMLPTGSYVVMDKGYTNYEQYLRWTQQGVHYITRMRENAVYTPVRSLHISDEVTGQIHILSDTIVEIVLKRGSGTVNVQQRRIEVWDAEKKRSFVFQTNNIDEQAQTIANIYKYRWQIELLFKKIKQNYPLKYFLGDNQNAIEIQIWCSLIALLLTEVFRSRVVKKWAFSNMVSLIRFHLMNYVHLIDFLNDPDKALRKTLLKTHQLALFPP